MSDFDHVVWSEELSKHEKSIANNYLTEMRKEKVKLADDYKKKRNNKLKLIDKTKELLIHYNLELTILTGEIKVIDTIIEESKMDKLLEHLKKKYKHIDDKEINI
tara:strand:+ start:22 stop:336 length:315 start_codon:yes stop_codon:yes gene_type:complete